MSADEFEIIRTLFAPLARDDSARGLRDDVAVLAAPERIVITTDAIVEGVHFLPDDPIETVARKALRVNLSDLAAKGARPIGVTLTLVWPQHRPSAEIARFAAGLGEDLQFYDVALLGGDTTATQGPLVVSITAFGEPLGPRTPARSDAAIGEHVWVSGGIGGAYVGLRFLTDAKIASALSGALKAISEDDPQHEQLARALISQTPSRYRIPQPPVRQAGVIAKYARASIDVSDGLMADAAKIAEVSNVMLRINAEAVPLLLEGETYVSLFGRAGLIELLNGGDDYQTLFTAPAGSKDEIVRAAHAAGAAFSLIGDVSEGRGVRLIDASGAEIEFEAGGFRHTLGQGR